MATTNEDFTLPELENARIELFNNGYPPSKGTQFGMVIDINGSAVRYNINFEDNSNGFNEISKLIKAKVLTDEHKEILTNVIELCKALDDHLEVTIAHGKYNLQAGNRHPITGKALYEFVPDYRVWVVFIRDANKPAGVLFYGDKMLGLCANQWDVKATAAEIKNPKYGTITHIYKI